MTDQSCERVTLADLVDYSLGELPESEATGVEEHLFSCADCGRRAAEYEALTSGLVKAVRGAQVGGLVTDDVLNRLSRDGIRVRSYALSPGDSVACAVWDGDEMMALRLRGDFSGVTEITMAQRMSDGVEIARASGAPVGAQAGEVIYALPAAWVRELPDAEIEVELTGDQRTIARYTLRHEGSLRRS